MNVEILNVNPEDVVRALIGEKIRTKDGPRMAREITYPEASVLLVIILGSRGGFYLEDDAAARRVSVLQAFYEERANRLQIAVKRLEEKGFLRSLQPDEIHEARLRAGDRPVVDGDALMAFLRSGGPAARSAPNAPAAEPSEPRPKGKPKRKRAPRRKPITGPAAEGADPIRRG